MAAELPAQPSPWRRRLARAALIALITLVSGLLHAWSAWQLPIDFDEPGYVSAGEDYAERIAAGDWAGVVDYPINREHPALVKLLYAIPHLGAEERAGSNQMLFASRAISALFGTLTTLLLALFDPLAGLLLAFHSLFLKYSSQAYLEAPPMFFSLLAVLALQRGQRPETGQRQRAAWWALSAVALGAAAAGKYPYAVVILPILALLFSRRPLRWPLLVGYVALAAVAFFALNPTVWRDPFERLYASLFFHARYTESQTVLRASYPWYQPLTWLTHSAPWHAEVFFFPTLDGLIFWAAILGLAVETWERPWVAAWVVGGIAVLLAWPTKWPQYTLIVIAALCIAASAAFRAAWRWAVQKEDYWNYVREVFPRPPRIFWVLTGLFLAALLAGRVATAAQIARAQRGWTQFRAETTPLPSNFLHEIAAGANNTLAIGTESGVAFWQPTGQAPWGETPRTERLGDQPIAVWAAAQSPDGDWWLGTDTGLRTGRPGRWQTVDGAALGLPDARVRAITFDRAGGVWVGAIGGAAYRAPGQDAWQAFVPREGGLNGAPVFDIAVQALPDGGEAIWFGTLAGVSRFDPASGAWTSDDFQQTLGWGGVSDLLVDRDGVVWAATMGHGLGWWDGSIWRFYQTTNSELPYNTVQRLYQDQEGYLWVSCSRASQPGGALARLDPAAGAWTIYKNWNSGFQGAEVIAFAEDPFGRLWLGTVAQGLQIFENPAIEGE